MNKATTRCSSCLCSASHAARCVACQGVRSQIVPHSWPLDSEKVPRTQKVHYLTRSYSALPR